MLVAEMILDHTALKFQAVSNKRRCFSSEIHGFSLPASGVLRQHHNQNQLQSLLTQPWVFQFSRSCWSGVQASAVCKSSFQALMKHPASEIILVTGVYCNSWHMMEFIIPQKPIFCLADVPPKTYSCVSQMLHLAKPLWKCAEVFI